VVGGGIRTDEDAAAVGAGAGKVSLNSAAPANPSLITTLARHADQFCLSAAIGSTRPARRAGISAAQTQAMTIQRRLMA
jgi:imidazole glycerol phosphate synthase subunit HisF